MAELVFLHGAADSKEVWQRQVEHFGRGHRVLAVDLPGHGARLQDTAYESVEDSAREVIRQIKDEGLSRPVLVGHSMGGGVALSLALQEPGLPAALALVASGARLRMRAGLIDGARQTAQLSAAGQITERVIPLEQVVSPHASSEVRSWVRQHFGRSTAQATYADFVATNGFDFMQRLHEIMQPTLVLAGEDDIWTPPKFQHYLAEGLAHGRLVMLPQAGHYPFIEHADAFNAELERFLNEVG
jgi:3-oxoadipate enol-lactonase